MGLVDEVRKKLGLEPKRIKTETGNVPDEIKVNRAIQEFAGYPQPIAVPLTTSVVPSPGKTNIRDKRPIKFSVGFDFDLMNQDRENQLQRRQAQKQIKQSLDFAEDTYISQFPGDFGPSVATVPDSTKPNPTAAAPSVPSKRKRMEELFGSPNISGDHGSPKFSDDGILGEFKPDNKKTSKKNIIKEEYNDISHDDRGKLFEILHAKHMNPSQQLSTHYRDEEGKSPKTIHDNIQSRISKEQYNRIDRHARESAERMRRHLSKEGHNPDHITHVAWTSNGANDVKKFTGHDDPHNDSDVMYKFKHPKTGEETFAGVSLKYGSSKHPNIRNPGLESLETSTGASGIISSFNKHKKRMRELGYTGTSKDNHEKWRNEKESKRGQEAEQSKLSTCREIAKNIHGALKKKNSNQLRRYVRDLVSPQTRHPVYRLHSHLSGSEATHYIDNPTQGIGSHLNKFSELMVDPNHSGGTSVVIRGRRKDSGKITRVLAHNVKGVSGPHRGIAATTRIPGYARKANEIKEEIDIVEIGLVEHVRTIISEAKNIDISHAISHWDPEASYHAREYLRLNKAMSDIVSDRTRNRPEEYAKHAEQAMMHHRKFKERLAQLDAGKKEGLQEVSQKLATKAYRERTWRADEKDRYDSHYDDHAWMDNPERDKAERTLERIRKKFGDKAAADAERNVDLKEDEDRGADSKGHKRPTEQGAGLTRKGVMAHRRENPGSKLSTAVTTPPSKLDPKGKAAARRRSFCARMGGMPGPMKDEKGRPTRKAMSLRRWNCEASEILKTLVEAKKMKGKDPCWKDYEMVGTKEKNGRTVPNCVPEDN